MEQRSIPAEVGPWTPSRLAGALGEQVMWTPTEYIASRGSRSCFDLFRDLSNPPCLGKRSCASFQGGR